MRIRPIILHSVIEDGTPPEHWELLRRILLMKKAGYEREYPQGVLPIDTSDFFGTHMVIGIDTPTGFEILTSYKVVTKTQAQHYLLLFPGLSLVQQAVAVEHTQLMNEILSRCDREGREIAYLSSWTMSEVLKQKADLRQELRQVFVGSILRLCQSLRAQEIIFGGTLRFKTDSLMTEVGFQPLRGIDDEILPPIRVRHLFGEPVQVMHLREFTLEAHREMKACQEFWENRQVLGFDPFVSVIRAA